MRARGSKPDIATVPPDGQTRIFFTLLPEKKPLASALARAPAPIRPSPTIPIGSEPEAPPSAPRPAATPPPPGELVTQFFSVDDLRLRQKVVQQPPASAPAAPLPAAPAAAIAASAPAPNATTDPELSASFIEPGPLGRVRRLWRRSSLVSRASLVLVPLMVALFALGPGLKQRRAASGRAAAPPPASAPAKGPAPAPAAASAAEASAAAAIPRVQSALPSDGRTNLAEKAAEAAADGRYDRALELYRKLAEQEPNAAVYREAARILERRAAKTPD